MEYREPKPWKNVLNHSGTDTKETTLIPVIEEITSKTLIECEVYSMLTGLKCSKKDKPDTKARHKNQTQNTKTRHKTQKPKTRMCF
jgi:hypothetical protein